MRGIALFIILLSGAISSAAMAEGDATSGKIKAYTCTGCHGIAGYNNIYPTYKVPKIGGQSAPYLVAALNAYKSGERLHPTMRLQAESLSDRDIDDISAWLSEFEAPQPEAEQATGAALSNTAGQEKSRLCEACHGVDGMGVEPVTPRLAGQHASYLEQTLKNYRDGKRNNLIMTAIAGSLDDRSIEALASWYAGMHGLRDLSGR